MSAVTEYNGMVWFKRRNKQSVPRPSDATPEYVDLDSDAPIPLEDPTNATSLMFMLSMEHGAVAMGRNLETGEAQVVVDGRTFSGANDLAALREAWVVMSHARE